MNEKTRKVLSALLPPALFLVLFWIGISTLEWYGKAGALNGYAAAVATLGAGLVRFLGVEAAAQGMRVTVSGGGGLLVNWPCSGLQLAAPIVAFFLAFPAPPLHRLLGTLAGFLVVQAVNVLRVGALIIMSCRAPAYLPLAHDTLWNALMIALVVIGWVVWTQRQKEGGRRELLE